LPRHDLDGLVGVRIPGDRGLGALVSSFTRRLPRHLDDGDAAARARVGTALVDLITAALAERVDRSGRVPARIGREVLRQQVVTYVERNLADPGLTPRAVAAANALSLRSLHQLFEAEPTTVAAFIRQRRVDACRRDLADPAMAQVAVAEIGARWGLRDPAHFSRVFRRTAGLTPTAFRERALA
jgi:AraC-like DNA-binding protein